MKVSRYIIIAIVFSQFILYSNCQLSGGGGSTTGNGLLKIAISPLQNRLLLDGENVQSLRLCLQALSFGLETNSGGPRFSQSGFLSGSTELRVDGTALGEIEIATGTYSQINLILSAYCPNSENPNSVELLNTHGRFTTGEDITISFLGDFVAEGGTTNIELDMQLILDKLKSVTANSSIKPEIESASGRISVVPK